MASLHIREHVPLAPLTTLGVGGAARYFAEVHSPGELREAMEFAGAYEVPLFTLGGGSNLVVADAGFAGLVLKLAIMRVSEQKEEGRVLLTAGAGEPWDDLVAYAVRCGFSGMECLSGIPGTVGATPVQNVGAYGQEVSDTIVEVKAWEAGGGELRSFTNDECEFTYRGSRFNTAERGQWIIVQVTFALTMDGRTNVSYADLKEVFGNSQPSPAEVRAAVLRIRESKGMRLVDGDEDCRSAGSFFKNPVLSAAAYRELQQRVAACGLTLPGYPALASQHKVPAAWLVEQAGFAKGYRRGRVGISHRHALAIVNRGGATAAEIIALKDEIQETVAAQFGIELQPEPVFLGF